MKKFRTFYVIGRGHFPIDMLRYAQAYPLDAESVENIEFVPRPVNVPPRTVKLGMTCNQGHLINVLTRFESFGWTGEVLS